MPASCPLAMPHCARDVHGCTNAAEDMDVRELPTAAAETAARPIYCTGRIPNVPVLPSGSNPITYSVEPFSYVTRY